MDYATITIPLTTTTGGHFINLKLGDSDDMALVTTLGDYTPNFACFFHNFEFSWWLATGIG